MEDGTFTSAKSMGRGHLGGPRRAGAAAEADSLRAVVLMATYSGAFGGAERLLLDFAAAFEDRCVVACPPGPLAGRARAAGHRVAELRPRRLELRAGPRDRALAAWRLVAHGAEVRSLASAHGAELVIAWGMRTALSLLVLGPRPGGRVAFQHNDLLPGRAIGALVRAAARRADVSVGLSDAIAREVGAGMGVVHPGIDVARFDAAPPSPDGPVLVVGALTAWKRPDLALEAVAIARRSDPRVRLRLVGAPLTDGDGALVAALRARAREPDLAGAVELAGAVPDVAGELAAASCVLHCAEREPFGMAVLEALAAARPVVVPAAAGPLEIVDQSCGLLYPPGDAAAAAQALVRLAGDPEAAAAMGAAGRARAAVRFGARRAVEDYRRAVRVLPRVSGLALVTVTRNSAGELTTLLTSLQRWAPGAAVVVVDCASSDDTVAVARAAGARVLALAENAGFGRGCNLGLDLVDAPATALVNPDIELIDNSLATLAARLADADRLLAPRIVYPDGSLQDSVHPLPGSAADLVRALVPPAAVPGALGTTLAPWRARIARRVGWAVGAALVARTETLRRLGPFDERIFLYGEDMDLGLRAARAGVETWFRPEATVIHHRAHSSAREFGGEPFAALAQTRHDVIARRLGPRAARRDDRAQTVTFRSRRALKLALGRDAERELRQLRALAGIHLRPVCPPLTRVS